MTDQHSDNHVPFDKEKILGVILAGGTSRRMGGVDKTVQQLNGKALLGCVLEKLEPQVSSVILNANGAPSQYSDYNLPVAGDVLQGHQGPLAGILTGLEWAKKNKPQVDYIATFPVDTPFIPSDLVQRLFEKVSKEETPIACASSGGRDHPVIALWRTSLAYELKKAFMDEGIRKVDAFTGRYQISRVEYGVDPVDPFFNVNTKEDLAQAENILNTKF